MEEKNHILMGSLPIFNKNRRRNKKMEDDKMREVCSKCFDRIQKDEEQFGFVNEYDLCENCREQWILLQEDLDKEKFGVLFMEDLDKGRIEVVGMSKEIRKK